MNRYKPSIAQLNAGIQVPTGEEHMFVIRRRLNVLVRIHYDPDRPDAWDDEMRLFTDEDDGATYDQAIALADSGDTQRAGRDLYVLFRDLVPNHTYSCFLDLGEVEGGYLLFHHQMVGVDQHVKGLPGA